MHGPLLLLAMLASPDLAANSVQAQQSLLPDTATKAMSHTQDQTGFIEVLSDRFDSSVKNSQPAGRKALLKANFGMDDGVV